LPAAAQIEPGRNTVLVWDTVLNGVENTYHLVIGSGSRSEGNAAMRKLNFGIASVAEQKARSLAIAAGTRQRAEHEPNVWFPSATAALRVLSDENMALLRFIREEQPESVSQVAQAMGKPAPNVSRSLHTMELFGLIRLVKRGRTVKPEALADRISLDFA
jgi:predicted transcriptional regulator